MYPYRTNQMGELRAIVDDQDADLIEHLVADMVADSGRLHTVSTYYEGTYQPKGLNVSIPKKLMHLINSGLGWGKIIVDTLAERLVIYDVQGVDLEGVIPFEQLRNVAVRLHTEILRYGRAYLLVSAHPETGEPVLTVRTPLNTAALVDQSTGRVSHGVSIEQDYKGTEYASVYLPGKVVALEREKTGEHFHIVDTMDSTVMPLIAFSNVGDVSEISPSIQSLMDMASTSLVYAKLNEEFFSFPQRYVLGVDEDTFRDANTGEPISKWKARIDSLFILERSESGNNPEVGEFRTNLSDGYMRMVEYLSSQVAAEAGLPATYFGISTQQALSAEAIEKMENRLVRKALTRRDLWSIPWAYTIETIAKLAGVTPSEQISVMWGSPRNPSLGATADAVVKLVGAGVLPATSNAVLQLLNIDTELQGELRTEQQAASAMSNLDRVLGALNEGE